MLLRPRLLPIVIVGALALFGFKAEHIVAGVMAWGVQSAVAKDNAAADKDASPATAATADAGDEAGDEAGDAAGAGAPRGRTRLAAGEREFTPSELEVLEHLSERREELDAWVARLEMRERVLGATEKRIDEKIASLKELEARIEKLLKQHDAESERQLKSLVKVYEAMKPKDAARIFEQLEMDILLDVTQRMREAKMAPVLAAMNAEKAKALTVELARRRVLPETGG